MTDQYCNVEDIKAILPFEAGSNSFPTEGMITGAQKVVHRYLNGLMKRTSDLTTNTGAIGALEAAKTADMVKAQVYGESFSLVLSEDEHRIINNYRDEEGYLFGKYGYYSD